MDFEDDVWVDEAEGTFQTYKTSDPSKVTELLRDMFNTHGDVYSLLLAFLDRAGRVRMQKDSLPRMLLTEFKTWLGEHEEKPKLVPGEILQADLQKNYYINFHSKLPEPLFSVRTRFSCV